MVVSGDPKVTQLDEDARADCHRCSLYRLCLLPAVGEEAFERFARLVKRRRPVAKGTHLFRAGEPFSVVYAIRTGAVKLSVAASDGDEQVTGFHLPGELVGLEAVSLGYYPATATTLERTSICAVPYGELEALAERQPAVRQQMINLMSRALYQEQRIAALAGKQTAQERLAALLLSLSERFRLRNLSAVEFDLSMTRHDIANHLGLDEATVSRVFSRLSQQGLLEVTRQHVRILDLAGLRALAGALPAVPDADH